MPRPADCTTKEEIRSEIDRLDQSIVALLAERFGYVRRMAELKQTPAEAYDGRRIDEILQRVRGTAGREGLDPDLAEDLWRRLIDWNVAWEERSIAALR